MSGRPLNHRLGQETCDFGLSCVSCNGLPVVAWGSACVASVSHPLGSLKLCLGGRVGFCSWGLSSRPRVPIVSRHHCGVAVVLSSWVVCAAWPFSFGSGLWLFASMVRASATARWSSLCMTFVVVVFWVQMGGVSPASNSWGIFSALGMEGCGACGDFCVPTNQGTSSRMSIVSLWWSISSVMTFSSACVVPVASSAASGLNQHAMSFVASASLTRFGSITMCFTYGSRP